MAVSGTKGKSTTAALTAHLAAAAGVTVALAGNIGVPAIELLDADPARLTVLELSSYQIADLDTGPEVVVMTNLFREHTEWHGSEDAYRREKLRLLSLPEVRVAVLNAREPLLTGAPTDAKVLLYGDPGGLGRGAGRCQQGRSSASSPRISCRSPGEHNALNLCAALTGLEALGIEPPLPSALEGFQPLAHRLQVVGEGDGITWVNDSISTTPESAIAALASFPGRELVLIAGGQDRGQDYAGLASALARVGRGRDRRPQHRRTRGRRGHGGRTHTRTRRRGGRPRAGRGRRPRAVRRPGRSCCCHRRLPASTTTATSSSGASASGNWCRGTRAVAGSNRAAVWVRAWGRRARIKNAAAPVRGRRRGSCAFQRLGAYGHSGVTGTSRHGFAIVSCTPGVGCGSRVRASEYAWSASR